MPPTAQTSSLPLPSRFSPPDSFPLPSPPGLADIGKFDSGTTCVLMPNTTVGGILQASPFEVLMAQQLKGVKRSLFYTITVRYASRRPAAPLRNRSSLGGRTSCPLAPPPVSRKRDK